MAKNFAELMGEIYRLAKVADPPNFLYEAVLEVDGVPFTLVDITSKEEDTVAYFCDFGPPPLLLEKRAEMFQGLLEANFLLFSRKAPTYSIEYETGHVYLMDMVSISKTDPKQLLGTLGSCALCAKQWKRGNFSAVLDKEKENLAAVSRRPSSGNTLRQQIQRNFIR